MKYALTGAAGTITKLLAEKLLKAGQEVRLIGRDAGRLKSLTDLGATAAVGTIYDTDFLKQAFAGVDAVYTMIPPKFDTVDWKADIGKAGESYASAIEVNGIRFVVNLSSTGAHLAEGGGPVSGLFRAESALNTLKDVNIKHLRPGYFYSNLLGNVGMVKQMNILGANFGGGAFKLILAHTNDIADIATEELLALKFSGHSVRYIAGDERSTEDIASVLGGSIGKPNLPWVVFSNEQAMGGMIQAGLPEEIARNYTEMGNALQAGDFSNDYWKHRPVLSKTKLEDFAKEFAAVFNKN